jgi:vacuolar-type H+-ATPase subunit H
MKKFIGKFLKKFLKWTGILLLVLIILLILIPILFKDQIKQMVIDEVNKSLTAELSLEDFDLTFISTFPNMTIELMNAKLTGKNEFDGVVLMDIENISAHVGLWDVISGDQIAIDEIHVTNPTFDVRVLQDGLANYDIVKPDSLKTPDQLEEPSSFKLSLQEYSITNAQISYDDEASGMSAKITNLNHTGSGDLTADIIDFVTSTSMDKLTFDMGGISYLYDVKTNAEVTLLMEFKENSSKFTLKENSFKLNEINFAINGSYEMLGDHDEIDLTLDASKATFKEFLSLIPTFYQSGYESMVSTGSLALNGTVKGRMDEKSLPGWDFGMKVSNGSVKYPDLPGKISNIQIDAGSKFPGGENLDRMTVDVPKFHANLSRNTLDANLSLRQLMSDPFIKSKILADVDLATLKDYVPMAEGESYRGKLDADVDIEGKMSDLEKGDFEAFRAAGELILSDFLYKSPDLPDEVDIKRVMFTFSPQNLTLNELKGKMGKTDFDMAGKVDNYFGYMLRDEPLKGDFTFNSNYLDLDALMPAETAESGGDAGASGETSSEPLLVPGNIDFTLNTTIGKTRYNDIDIKNIRGNVRLKDEVATLENLTMNAMGGTVGVRGSYNTQNHREPKLDFGYNLQEVDIHELSTHFLTVEKLAPITKYAYGKISSNFDMTTTLTSALEPVLSSLTSNGDISSNNLTIKGFKNLEKLETVTKLKNISNQTLKGFKTYFKVADGKVTVTPFNINLGKITSEVSGYTTLEQQMDYKLKMNIPKDQIPASIIKEVEGLLKKANAAVPFIKLTELPAVIPVNVKMIGSTTDPKITTDMKEAIMSALGLEGNIIDNIKDQIKDTVTQVINQQIDNAKEELEKQKQKILADAQKQADRVKAECNTQAENVWKEAYKQADELVKQAGSNPLKKKLAEEAAKKAKQEADKQLTKAKGECQKKADDIMAKGRAEADKLK